MSSAATAAPMPFSAPTNWPMISGFSGLPKFRLSVVASGFAPDGGQVAIGLGHRLLAAFHRVCAHVARRHVRGEDKRLVVPCTRTMPAPRPGPRTVSAMTMCRIVRRPTAWRHGWARRSAPSARRSGPRRAPGPSRPPGAVSTQGRSYSGASRQLGQRQVGHDLCHAGSRSGPRQSVSPTMAKSRSHFSNTARASASRSGFSTISMRSWLSLSIIS